MVTRFFKEYVRNQIHDVNDYIEIYYESVPQTIFLIEFLNLVLSLLLVCTYVAYNDPPLIMTFKDIHVHVLVRKFTLFQEHTIVFQGTV